MVIRRSMAAALLLFAACGSAVEPAEPGAPAFAWTRPDAAGAGARPYADAELAVFITRFDHRVVGMDARTGAVRWTRELPALLPGRYLPAGNVLGYGDLLVVPGWDLYALDRATGAVRWRYAAEDEYPATDAVALADGRIYSPGATRLHAVSAADGSLLWEAELGERPFAPVTDGAVVYLGTRRLVPGTDALADGHAVAIDAASGRVLWRTPIPGHPQHPREGGVNRAGVLTGDLFLVGSRNGRVYALDRATGAVRWEHVGEAAYEAGVAVVDGVAVVPTLNGRVEGLEVSSGRLLWTVNLGGSSVITPVVAEDGCALVTVGAVLCVDAAGRVRWQSGGAARNGPSFTTAPRAAAGRLFVGSTSGFHALSLR